MLAALITLMAMAAMGGVVSYMVASNQQGRTGHLQSLEALYVAQAGLEYVIKKIYEGEDGTIVNPVPMGKGTFTSERSGRTLSIIGKVGDATRVYLVDSPTEADCTSNYPTVISLENGGTRLRWAASLAKACLPSVTITQVVFSWGPNNGERLMAIEMGTPGSYSTVYYNAVGIPSGTLAETSDYGVPATGILIDNVDFMSPMNGKTLNMQLNFADGASKVITATTPP